MIDIYSNSWGPGDMGWEVEGPGKLTGRALELGIKQVHVTTLRGELHKTSCQTFTPVKVAILTSHVSGSAQR